MFFFLFKMELQYFLTRTIRFGFLDSTILLESADAAKECFFGGIFMSIDAVN
jgi:hypothetical protein